MRVCNTGLQKWQKLSSMSGNVEVYVDITCSCCSTICKGTNARKGIQEFKSSVLKKEEEMWKVAKAQS